MLLLHSPAVHHGRNILRFRKALGVDTDQLAQRLGEAWTARQVTEMEVRPVLPVSLLVQVAEALCIPAALLCRLEEESNPLLPAHAGRTGTVHLAVNDMFNHCPEQVEQLLVKLATLYERLLVSEREKAGLRVRLCEGRKGV